MKFTLLIFIGTNLSFLISSLSFNLGKSGIWIKGRNHYESYQENTFFSSRQILASNQLNMTLLGGFQEVYLKLDGDKKQIDFSVDITISRNTELYILFKEGNSRFGLRLSRNPNYTNGFVTVNRDGEFRDKKEIESLTLPEIFNLKVHLQNGKLFAHILGQRYSYYLPPDNLIGNENVYLGFKGGTAFLDRPLAFYKNEKSAAVDNLKIRTSKSIRELSFNNYPSLNLFLISIFFTLMVGGGLWKSLKQENLIVIFLCLSLFYLLDRYYLSHRFFSTPPLLTSAFAAYDQGKIDDIKNLKKKFNESFSHYDKKIVVFGGSNTVGTGALDYQSTWSAFLNKMSQKDIAYISWGVLGATTEDMKHYFLETVELTKPYCVLFYIGINDSVCYQCMKENLNDFSKQLKEQGIKMVIAPEVDAEYVLSAEPMLSYKILKQFTKSSKDVSFYDIPMALKQIAQEDRGIMWSDNVHLTSYGQRKLAESILKKPFSCL